MLKTVNAQDCAICGASASASMKSEAVVGRDVAAAEALHQRLRAVLTGAAEAEGAHLGKLISPAGVRRYPSRIKCALFGWPALMHGLADEPNATTAP